MADEQTPSDAPANEPDPAPEPPAETSEVSLLDDEEIPEAVRRAIKEQGRRAIEAERKARKAAEKQLAETIQLLEASPAAKDEAQALKVLEDMRAAGRSEAEAEYHERLLTAEVRAAAAGMLNDPNDAIALLDLSEFEAQADGSFDTEAIKAAIAELTAEKPYLAPRAIGTGGGGARPQTPALSRDQQIDELERAGDYRSALSLKNEALREALLNPS